MIKINNPNNMTKILKNYLEYAILKFISLFICSTLSMLTSHVLICSYRLPDAHRKVYHDVKVSQYSYRVVISLNIFLGLI